MIKCKEGSEGETQVKVKGICNFLSILRLDKKLSAISPGKDVVVDLSVARLVDFSVLEYLDDYVSKYRQHGGHMEIRGLDRHLTSSTHPHALHVLFRKPTPVLNTREAQTQSPGC